MKRVHGSKILVAPPAGPTLEVACHDMPNKVIPFPRAQSQPEVDVPTTSHTRIRLRVGGREYAFDIPCEVTPVRPRRLEQQTAGRPRAFSALRQPFALGDLRDGRAVQMQRYAARLHFLAKTDWSIIVVDRFVVTAQSALSERSQATFFGERFMAIL